MANQNDSCVVLSPAAIVTFTVTILQQATVKPPNIIVLEKGFTFYAQPQTGAYILVRLKIYQNVYSNLQ